MSIKDENWYSDFGAMNGCPIIKEIELPANTDDLPMYVFANCENLETVHIPKRLKKIGKRAFENCRNLKNIYIEDLKSFMEIEYEQDRIEGKNPVGDEMTCITSNPFVYASNLYLNGKPVEELVIPEDITEIPDYAFFGCECIKSIKFPKNLRKIGNLAFCGTGIREIKIPKTVEHIGKAAFGYSPFLEVAEFEEGCKNIGKMTFVHDPNLKHLYVAESVNVINKEFCQCIENLIYNDYKGGRYLGTRENPYAHLIQAVKNTESFTLAKTVKNITDNVFCKASLRSIEIPDGTRRIGKKAFSLCSALKEIKIVGNVKTIEPDAFFGDVHIEKIDIGKSVGGFNFLLFSDSDLKEASIEEGYRTIRKEVFIMFRDFKYNVFDNALYIGSSGNPYIYLVSASGDKITSCNVHKDTRYICPGAFSECDNLKEIRLPKKIGFGTFAFAPDTEIIRV